MREKIISAVVMLLIALLIVGLAYVAFAFWFGDFLADRFVAPSRR